MHFVCATASVMCCVSLVYSVCTTTSPFCCVNKPCIVFLLHLFFHPLYYVYCVCIEYCVYYAVLNWAVLYTANAVHYVNPIVFVILCVLCLLCVSCIVLLYCILWYYNYCVLPVQGVVCCGCMFALLLPTHSAVYVHMYCVLPAQVCCMCKSCMMFAVLPVWCAMWGLR